MIGDPLGRCSRDIAEAGRAINEAELTQVVAEALAPAVSEEAPVVTGFLAGSVYVDDQGVGVGAVYAGVVHDSNPYAERAVNRVDPGEAAQQYVDQILDDHLAALYV